jgi:6-phosphofructokinase 1
MSTSNDQKTIGVLVGGGPAPGLNGVIHGVTITAINNGFQVLGILEGFKYLAEGNPRFRPLTISNISRIHRQGGTILKTSRANPTRQEETLRNTVNALKEAGITYLVSIGGDDTAFSAYTVSRYAQEKMGLDLRSVHVPKTIDNDLPLPEGVPTFGYTTAREFGMQVVGNIMEDALSTTRWYIVVAMGRKAGHLALGIGKTAGATLTLIPEEWRGETIRLQHVSDIICGSVIKRLANGRGHGVAVVAEGVMELMDPNDLEFLETVERDEHGHPRLAEINSAAIIKRYVRAALQEIGIKITIVDKEVGYELRCTDPCAFDVDYTRTLGQVAVDFLLEGGTNAMITIQNNKPVPMPYDQIMDPETGHTEVRMVNVDAFTYRSARKFMIRLEKEDLQDEQQIAKLTSCTNLTPKQFVERFGYLGGVMPRPF